MRSNFFLHIFSFALFLVGTTFSYAQYIEVDTTYTPQQLIEKFVGTNTNCFNIDNISITGWNNEGKSYGYFTKGSSNFDIDDGIILSTGLAQDAEGPKNYDQNFEGNDWNGDRDLDEEIGNITVDATSLEFDFTPTVDGNISFEYMLLSEEFYINKNGKPNCSYSDALAFFIKNANEADNSYINFAYIPNTSLPVTVPNIACNTTGHFGGYIGQDSPTTSPTNFSGQSTVMKAETYVKKNITYRIKIVIADQQESQQYYHGIFDSAVFLKAGSFKGNKDIGGDHLISLGNAICQDNPFTLNAETDDATSYTWYKDGSVISGKTSAQYTVTEPGFYEVGIDVSGCVISGSAKIEYAEKPIFNNDFTEINLPCVENPNEAAKYQLTDLIPLAIENLKDYFEVEFYDEKGNLFANEISVSKDTTVLMKVKYGDCEPETKAIKLMYKSPRKSELLDKLNNTTICQDEQIHLEAENDFAHYKWMKDGETLSEGDDVYFIDAIGAGNYSVKLTNDNGCIFVQQINILPAEEPTITHIDVSGSTATVFVSGGTAPYQYSLDGITYQSTNVFYDIPRGVHKAYVKSADDCYVVEKEFLLVNLINVITPNGDGKNDVLDYSDLRLKSNVSIQIFNRLGQTVFQSEGQNYIWDGKISGRPAPTGTYWYLLNWEEPDTNVKTTYTGWVLVKNRD